MKREQIHAFRLVFAVLMFGASTGAVIAETPRSMLDGDVFAAEANYVELVVGTSGDVVEVRVEGCETCEQDSYLPSRDLTVSKQGQPVDATRLVDINGRAGTLVLSVGSQLVQSVDFWVPRVEEGDDQ